MTWKASLAFVFLDLWQMCSTPHRTLFLLITAFIDLYMSALSAWVICWLADREGQNHAGFSFYCHYKKLLASAESVLYFYRSQLNWLGSHPKPKVWVKRHAAQQCLNLNHFGLGGCPYPKLNPCLTGSHSRSPPPMFPHGDKGVSPSGQERIPACKSNQQLLSHHFKVISAKAEDFSFFGTRADSASSSCR